jgi:hypothetical protein
MTTDRGKRVKNNKLQIPNIKQISNHKSQIPNRAFFSFVISVIGFWDLFVIWCLGFGIYFIINATIFLP